MIKLKDKTEALKTSGEESPKNHRRLVKHDDLSKCFLPESLFALQLCVFISRDLGQEKK